MSYTPTLGYGQERNNRDSVTVRAAHAIVHISYGKVEWIILILSGGDGHGGLVTPENYWHEGRSLCSGSHIFRDDVLAARCENMPVETDANINCIPPDAMPSHRS